MTKIHTRVKRRFGLSTRFSHYSFFHPHIKKNRPRTFKTEEAANTWALSHSLKEEQYYLKGVKKGKKFQIGVQNGQDERIIDNKV